MARRDDEYDYDDNDDDEVESFDEDDDDTTFPCPLCREPVYEDAERCPHCGKYLSDENAPFQRKPWWLIIGVMVCLYMVYRWTVG